MDYIELKVDSELFDELNKLSNEQEITRGELIRFFTSNYFNL